MAIWMSPTTTTTRVSTAPHVAGIAAANRYLEQDGAYVDAMEEVQVAGNAPDAQLLVMKVFGKNGGAFDSDIMVAIEDAMILGADAVNLSLGSSSAGTATIEDSTYRALMERVVESGMVVVTSAGNDGYWSMYSTGGYLYSDDVNYDTVGSPVSYASSWQWPLWTTMASLVPAWLWTAIPWATWKVSWTTTATPSVMLPFPPWTLPRTAVARPTISSW